MAVDYGCCCDADDLFVDVRIGSLGNGNQELNYGENFAVTVLSLSIVGLHGRTPLVKNFFGNADGVGTNGPAGIHSGVQNYFTDLRLCYAVVQCPANVTSELIGPIKYWRLSSAGTKPQLL